ncbi:hypothetical protein, partial [Escherichia coli]|uniref:hypothetical protein n=1 Tax=Escherichia coli TaxID=562 RepID=UPI003EE4148E
AENAGGVHCLKYGLTVHNLLKIEVQTLDGEALTLIAETSSGFVEAFFACQYAGLVAVPLAIPMGVG